LSRNLNTSPLGRLLRIGTLATRVTTSVAVEQVLGFALASPVAKLRRTENFALNAMRVSEALGEMKGAAMKLGQMLSVHEGLLPPEVCQALQSLQRDAPAVPYARMRAVLEAEVPGGLARFSELATEPLAAASIGQVYRGRLTDGREVAVKVQYPDIDRVVAADLKNLKKLVGSLVAMFVDIDFEPFWREMRERLLEELDYRQEAQNIGRMGTLYADDPAIIVPEVIPEASGQRVLTMAYVPGIDAESACSDRYDAALRDRWGERHLSFVMRGLIEHRFLHADPNFGNYAFREDGAMVVYDHGCVKQVPTAVAAGCARVLEACLAQDLVALPEALHALGVYNRSTGPRVPQHVVAPIGGELLKIVGPTPYRFSKATTLYETLLDPRGNLLTELSRLELPPELTFVNRTLSGVFGNLCRLRATGQWREVLAPFTASGAATREQQRGDSLHPGD
jgi:predicted unusual protein kinase regulating ubiquinone biosynthesis (AarF/ABC1/UbiB family)